MRSDTQPASEEICAHTPPPGTTSEDTEDQQRVATTPEQRRRAVGLLFVSLISMGMNGTLIFAALPELMRGVLGYGEFYLGLLFAVSGIAWVLASSFWGHRSDIWGRRPVLILGFAGYAAGSLLFAISIHLGVAGLLGLVATYVGMLSGRLIFALLGAGTVAAAQAYLVDRTTRAQRTSAVAAISGAYGIGGVLGPGVGALLVVFGLLAPFYVLPILGACSLVAIFLLLPEHFSPPPARERPKFMSPLDKRISSLLLLVLMTGAVSSVPLVTMSLYIADTMDVPPQQVIQMSGTGLMAFAMASLVSQLVLIRRFRLSAKMLVRAGTAISLVSFGIILALPYYFPLVIALIVGGLGLGLARPGIVAACSLAVGPDQQGAVAGVANGAMTLGFTLCPIMALPLYQMAPQAPFYFAIALACLVLAMSFFMTVFKIAPEPATSRA